MTTVALNAVPRSDFGKGAARRIRREGNIPAVIYGSGTELVHCALPTHDLDLALRKPRVVLSVTVDGATLLVKPRDIQRDPVKRSLDHVDLVIISKEEARERGEMAEAIKTATEAAEEAGMDAAAAVQALEEAVAAGENPTAPPSTPWPTPSTRPRSTPRLLSTRLRSRPLRLPSPARTRPRLLPPPRSSAVRCPIRGWLSASAIPDLSTRRRVTTSARWSSTNWPTT